MAALPSYTIEQAETLLVDAILLNANAEMDRVSQYALDAFSERLHGYLEMARHEAASRIGAKHLFSENWLGCELADVLATCERIRGASAGRPGASSLRSPEPVPVSAHSGNAPSRKRRAA